MNERIGSVRDHSLYCLISIYAIHVVLFHMSLGNQAQPGRDVLQEIGINTIASKLGSTKIAAANDSRPQNVERTLLEFDDGVEILINNVVNSATWSDVPAAKPQFPHQVIFQFYYYISLLPSYRIINFFFSSL